MVFYFWGSKQIAVLNSQLLWLGETLRLATQWMWISTRMNKGLAHLSGRLIKPRCDGMEMQLCRDSSELFVSPCLNCTWRKCCCVLPGRSLGFMHHAPIFGVCVREPNLSSQGWWDGCLPGAELLWNHCLPFTCPAPSSGYQNRYWPCIHSKPTASAWLLFFLLFSTNEPGWAAGKEQGGSGSTHLKHFSSLDHGDVIWENLWQYLKPWVVTKVSDAAGDRQGLCAPCAAQSLTSLGSFKIQAAHVHCGINSQVDDPNKKNNNMIRWQTVWCCTQG